MIFHPQYIIANTILFRDNPADQAALGLGGMILRIFLLSLGMTFNGSLDTLISQAFGQKDLKLCRIYLNRQLYLTTIVFAFLTIPVLFTKQIMMWFGVEAQISEVASTYVLICIPGALFYSWQSCYIRYLVG